MSLGNKQLKLHRNSGFSILEIAIALSVLAFLSYGLASTLKTGRDYEQYFENRKVLLEAKTALIAFAQSNGYLPCPDGDGTIDGVETRVSGICSHTSGRLPYQTLGLAEHDEWGNYIYYAIATNATTAADANNPALIASYFNANSAPVFGLDTAPLAEAAVTGSNKVCNETAVICNSTTLTDSTKGAEEAAVVVLVSFGNNGEYTWSNLGTASAFGTREFENADGDNYFWKETGSYSDSDGFDDQVVWLTGFDIKYAMLRSDFGLSE